MYPNSTSINYVLRTFNFEGNKKIYTTQQKQTKNKINVPRGWEVKVGVCFWMLKTKQNSYVQNVIPKNQCIVASFCIIYTHTFFGCVPMYHHQMWPGLFVKRKSEKLEHFVLFVSCFVWIHIHVLCTCACFSMMWCEGLLVSWTNENSYKQLKIKLPYSGTKLLIKIVYAQNNDFKVTLRKFFFHPWL